MKARLLVLRYFDGLTEESVMDFINASRNTYYAWKKDVLDTVAFHAAQKGLFIDKICIQMQGEMAENR